MVGTREANGSRSNNDLMRLSLEAAVEFDRLGRGKDVDREIVDAFARCLDEDTALPNDSLYLHHGPRTLDAYHRAWKSISGSKLDTIDDLKSKLSELIAEVLTTIDDRQLAADEDARVRFFRMETFCLALHNALLSERPSRRRAKRMRI